MFWESSSLQQYNALRLVIAHIESYSSRWAVGDFERKSGDLQAILYAPSKCSPNHLPNGCMLTPDWMIESIPWISYTSNPSSPRLWPWRFYRSHHVFESFSHSSKNYLFDTSDSHLNSTGTVFEANSTTASPVRRWRLHTPLCKRCATSR